ncbi:Rqc2 family fibronectin-binding protein [Halarsenatibacter silvermanii]|uniref:Rqc2 homolog RqcH n=1 Tax=Halarsenatibacter silvermanii TaxID=321763 RepID=A0A1G9JKP4_9FIRM|nr:NFACT RNA binding domain-containing protein [Halarsenatibacter silvermanii]SDL37842.1 Predicted component of the ribosome quality control (RQC) complex, YloA/Tae2 family, contains fibronectin-binding (FbpA) and DUF814 domains [Halarsenatibacter silvermanii]
MAIDGVMLSCCRRELEDELKGAKVGKAYQPMKDFLTLRLRNNGQNLTMLVSIDPRQSRIHLTSLDFENPQKPPVFSMVLRKHLNGGKIINIEQPGMERMLVFNVKRGNKRYKLIAEIMGRYSNVILVDSQDQVKDALKRIPPEKDSQRVLMPNSEYQPPPPQDKVNPYRISDMSWNDIVGGNFRKYAYRAILNNVQGFGPDLAREIVYRADVDPETNYHRLKSKEKEAIGSSFFEFLARIKSEDYQPALGIDDEGETAYISAFPLHHYEEIEPQYFPDTASLFDYFYQNQIVKKDIERKRKQLEDIIKNYQEKNSKQQDKFKGKLKESREAEKYKKKGELLKANLEKVRPGQKEIEVINYYDENQPEIKIELNPDISPAENVDKYFDKYNKLKKSEEHIIKELARLRHERKYLSRVRYELSQAEDLGDLEEIENELIEEKYIQDKSQKKNSKKGKKAEPRRFFSEDGYQILVGRNNRQNDELTTKVASDKDIWVHTRKIAGSHVIIRNHRPGKEIPHSTIEEAAVLAAYYSKARQSENVPVDYTEIPNVNKPGGARPGIVYYDDHSTLYVNPDEEKVKDIATRGKPADL